MYSNQSNFKFEYLGEFEVKLEKLSFSLGTEKNGSTDEKTR